jgi:hypothetical protein
LRALILFFSCHWQQSECAELLLRAGANSEARASNNGVSCVELAQENARLLELLEAAAKGMPSCTCMCFKARFDVSLFLARAELNSSMSNTSEIMRRTHAKRVREKRRSTAGGLSLSHANRVSF